ncbi:unnamed protein product [Calicophoron daubneyi]|uniref:Cadherin domain-containing protein n=1 Tax=Calicophoron daubneyi TaxID=300641 RepID=A0AAV2T965_CALDB
MQSIALARWIIHCFLVQLLLFVADIRTRLIRFVIDEELSQGTPIGSLLDHVPGSYDNLKFVKLTNTEDASALFAVDEFSGELTVAARLDRETLCLVPSSTPVSSTDRVAGRSTIGFEWTHPNVAIPCELRFSINCLSASSPSSSLVPVGGILVVLFDIVVTLRDINDNGCTFYPSDRQIIHLNEDAPVGKTTVPLHFPFDPDDAKLGHAVRQDSIHIVLGRPNEQSVIPGPRYEPSDLFKLNILPIHSNGSFSTFSSTNKHSNNFRLELQLIRALDYEQQQNFTFEIIANDNVISAKHQCKLSVTVLIDDCNDNSPVFEKTLYTSNISENTPVGTLITQLRAKDADSGPQGTVFYRIHGSSDQSAAYFHLNSSTGKLRLQKRLNYAHKSLHVLDILAENDVTNSRCQTSTTSQQRAFTRVQLQVVDVNDQAPKIRIFSPAGSNKLEVLEESPAGQDFAIVDVTDEDTGENAKVECMVGNRSLSKTLKMTPVESESDDPDKGTRQKRRYKLTLSKSLDREKMQLLDFTILCWDKGSPSLTSEIPGTLSLVDVNDNPPKFAKSNYHVMITEDSDPDRTRHNFEFLTVSATDPDAGVNSKILYSLDPGMRKSLLSLIKIDPNSGVLSTTGSLDRELVEQLTFRVFATDMGTPQKSSYAVVTVQVLDYNDNAPKFSKSAYNFDLVENSPVGHLIGSLSLSDSDINKNAEVKVKIEENFERTKQHSSSLLNQPDLFGIGGLSSSSGYKIHTPPSHSVSMSPQIRLVTFQVPHISKDAEERSNQTMYEIQLYTTSVWDREAFLPSVKNLLTDEFFGSSGTNFASYWKNQNLFNQSRADPIIVVKVQAEDQGKPRLVSQTVVQIRVRDINDNSPTFLFPNPKNFNLTRITLSNQEPKGFIFAQASRRLHDPATRSEGGYYADHVPPLEQVALNLDDQAKQHQRLRAVDRSHVNLLTVNSHQSCSFSLPTGFDGITSDQAAVDGFLIRTCERNSHRWQ